MSDGQGTSGLERLIERNHAETGQDIARLEAQHATNHAALVAQLDRYLLTQVYDADERARRARDDARDERIKRLEKAAEEEQKRRDEDRTSNRRMLRSAIVVAVFGVVSTVISAALVAALVKGGGH